MSDSVVVDLSRFDVLPKSNEGADMPLLDPTGRATGATFKLRGMDSAEHQEMQRTQVRRAIARAPRKPTEDERNADFYELNATLVAGWHVDGKPAKLVFEKDGPALECTPANVARVLERHQWVFEQVLRFAGNRANFLQGSASG